MKKNLVYDNIIKHINKHINMKNPYKYSLKYYVDMIFYVFKNGISWRELTKHPCVKNKYPNH